MEDVLEVYPRARDENQRLVKLDEFYKQLLGAVNEPRPCGPGHPE